MPVEQRVENAWPFSPSGASRALPDLTLFPKSHRLLKSADFTAVLKGAELNKASGPLRLRARKNRMPFARLGLVVTKKGNRTAVRRNRIKRMIRARFQDRQVELAGFDIVVQVFGALEDEQINKGLNKLLDAVAEKSDQLGER